MAGIVGQNLHAGAAEDLQHPGGDAVIALVVVEAERCVGIQRVETFVLQLVGPHLVGEPQPATLLFEIQDDATPLFLEPDDRQSELIAAIATPRTEYIPGQASRMQPQGHGARHVGIANDDGGRTAPYRVAKNHEPRLHAAVQWDVSLGGDGKRFDRHVAKFQDESAPTRVSAATPGRGVPFRSATSSAGNRCASLASSIAASAFAPAGIIWTAGLHRCRQPGPWSQPHRRHLASARPTAPVASRPSTRARLEVITTRNAAGAQSCRNAVKRSSVMPSIGKAIVDPARDSMVTGRPERNSPSPRSTAIWSADPNGAAKAALARSITEGLQPRLCPLSLGSSATLDAKTGVFTITLSKYHDTMATAPKAPPGRAADGTPSNDNTDTWAQVPRILRESEFLLPPPWQEIFGPLRHGIHDDMVVVGQFGQSIDARVATASGHSHYINGPEGLTHLHRLRALVDAVIIGVGTAVADDPQLTVRRVAGPNPARVVIDPRGRIPPTARLLTADAVRRLVITGTSSHVELPSDIEVVRLPLRDGQMAPNAILAALAERGFRRVLVEGGSTTVSRFLGAGCLDRLHVMIAPMIIGGGPVSVSLAPIERLEQAIRAPIRAHVLGDDILLDCDLSGQRIGIGIAKKSV